MPPQFTSRPSNATLLAWDKLSETERRLDAFDWAAMVVQHPRRCTLLINDLAFAFILSFETTLQVLGHEFQLAVPFERWLSSRREYDVRCRGIRTLRNLEAHIRAGQIVAGVGRGAYSRFYGGHYQAHGVAWRLPSLSSSEVGRLKRHGRKIEDAELLSWNALIDAEGATDSMREALISLASIVAAAQ